MKKLVIAEKPSVARDLTKVLGRFKKVDDYYENDEFVITSAVGHLVELYMPEDIDKKRYGFWRMGELPIIPEEFKLKPISDKRSKEKLNELKKLLKRKDVDEVLNACDAGREGELIFTYIYELAGCKKPYRRVWMQSMTPGAIKEAFENLREPEKVKGLQDAARSRSEADWLIGINGTRALTKRIFGRSRGVATVGRVQTPTLSIVLQREKEIRSFKPRSYWKIHGEFNVTEGDYTGTYQKEEKVNSDDNHDKIDRIWDESQANAIVESIKDTGIASVTEKKKRTRQSSGRLYDLTSLQREANSRFGLPAGKTLRIAQALYEKHKVLTYPRTSSRALPEDYIPTVKSALSNLNGELGEKAAKVLEFGWVKPNKRIFNNAQVTDHFAIIPTGQHANKLSADESKIYDMVCRRFIAIFYPPAEFDVTTRISVVGEHRFTSEGKVLVKSGYLEVYGKAQLDRQMPPLVDADKNPDWANEADLKVLDSGAFAAKPTSIDIEADETKPPSRFTEATLLSAMEGAGKLVEDDELAEAMKENGLGTPATRASTIDHLLNEKYLERDARYLLPTVKAENLFEFLEAIKVEEFTQPDLTGEWEHKLLMMEQNQLSRSEFMKGIKGLTEKIVERTKGFEEKDEDANESSIVSPTDEKPMLEFLRSYKSQDGEILVYKTIAGRKLDESEIQTLVKERVVGPLDGFRSKAGKPFSAILRLDAMNKVSFDFGDKGEDGEGEDIDLSTLNKVGIWEEGKEPVYEGPSSYATEQGIKGDRNGTFCVSRIMLGKTLPKEEIKNLLENGKTGLIKGFKSKRTGRNFDAFLTLKPKGKIGFEFPPRKAKKKAAKKKSAKKS